MKTHKSKGSAGNAYMTSHDPDSSLGPVHIVDHDFAVTVARSVKANAERAFEDAKFLYDNARYRSAIPLFITCIRESTKAAELSGMIYEDIDMAEWNGFHARHRAGVQSATVIGLIESASKEIKSEISSRLGIDAEERMEEIALAEMADIGVISQYGVLEELCAGHAWDEPSSSWDTFDNLAGKAKKDLAYHMMKTADMRMSSMDAVFQVLDRAESGKDVEHFMADHRDVQMDRSTHSHGILVMESILAPSARSIMDLSFEDSGLRDCLLRTLSNNDERWSPHIMLSSILNALSAMLRSGRDGEYAGSSMDPVTRGGGRPLEFLSLLSRRDGVIRLEKIMINGRIYSFDDAPIREIITTEETIDRYKDKIPEKPLRDALEKVDIRIKVMKKSDIKTAINIAISACGGNYENLSEGAIAYVRDLPSEIRKTIESTNIRNWDDRSPAVLQCITQIYVTTTPDKPNLVIADKSGLVKLKLRRMIMDVILSNHLGRLHDA